MKASCRKENTQLTTWVAESRLDRPTMIAWDCAPDVPLPAYATGAGVEVLLAGELFELDDVAAHWNVPPAKATNPAAVVLHAYEHRHESWTDILNGRFAVIIADRHRRRSIAARDRIGFHSLYVATRPGRLLASPSIPDLLSDPDVPRRLNRVVVAEQLLQRFVDVRETHFDGISRVPGGHVWTVGAQVTTDRYWDPGRSMTWLHESDLGLFDQAFERAVARCLTGNRRPAIFLSGGFDSVSVAAKATDIIKSRNGAAATPHALSLAFPGDEGEWFLQRSVADTLNLSQDFVPFADALSHRGLIQSALELGARCPLPLVNVWSPAYLHLARVGAANGCGSILTGTGGDEWLNVSPYLAADLMRAGRLRSLARLFQMFRRSFSFPVTRVARNVFWRFGLRPLVGAAADAVAPQWYAEWRTNNVIRSTPAWIAPDPELRRQMDERAPAQLRDPRPRGGLYEQEMRSSLDTPLAAMEYEEHFDFGRATRMPQFHPYLDPDLVALLYRTPPALLASGGRTKALVRMMTAQRFPQLGYKTQRKSDATEFHQDLLRNEGGLIWANGRGVPCLASLGIVDAPRLSVEMESLISRKQPDHLYRVWNVLNLEGWVGAHV